MNSIILIGRLTADPDLKFLSTGIAISNLTLAIDRSYRKDNQAVTDFIPVEIWGKKAEYCATYIEKGYLVAVNGSLHIDRYVDTSGNNRTFAKVVANSIAKLSAPKDNSGSSFEVNANSSGGISDNSYGGSETNANSGGGINNNSINEAGNNSDGESGYKSSAEHVSESSNKSGDEQSAESVVESSDNAQSQNNAQNQSNTSNNNEQNQDNNPITNAPALQDDEVPF